MRTLMLLIVGWCGMVVLARGTPQPADVAVLYNSADAESKKLAEIYRDARGIPAENLVGLKMPAKADLTREEYVATIQNPLRAEFEKRKWMKMGRDSNGVTLPRENKIKVMAIMRGVPLRIQQGPSKEPPNPQNPIVGNNMAAVDSELAMFAVDGVPMDGILKNVFYESTKSITEVNFPFMVLTARIDAPRFETCERMIRDAIDTEKTGLWGRAYVDIANKVPMGDQWFEEIAKDNAAQGIPTVVDRFNDTFPTNYPATEMALYYGWYDWNVSGPFLNSRFAFRKGAVAMHLHSFSAEQLRDGSKNWCAPLLERGAAATVGNVYEPYLHLTHHFEILHRALLAGYTFVEAAWMAMPVTSWQGVVLGDPLYRPFLHLDNTGAKRDEDVEFRALRAAAVEWKTSPAEKQKQLEKASERMSSGVLAEALGLDFVQAGRTAEAATWFRTAKGYYVKNDDKLRQDFHLIAIERATGQKPLAVRSLREAQVRYGPIPEAEGLKGWLDILDPPPPPIADPTKSPVPVK